MRTRDEALERIRVTLVELFELEPAQVQLGARLYEDLEIDSIDAVDLMDQLRAETGKRVSSEDFKSVRTVSDLADVVLRLAQA